MKKLFLAFIFSVSLVFAQSVKIEDTVYVTLFQEFSVPSKGALVMSNITRVNSITCQILDQNMNKVKDVPNLFQRPTNDDVVKRSAADGGRGVAVQAVFTDDIDQTGTFYAKISVNCTGERGVALVADRYYLVIVDHPQIAAPVAVRDKYYFSEKESFSFATQEYTDQSLYTYTISNGGSVVESGNGPFINLESLFNVVENVGSSFTINGYYAGDLIEFRDPISNDVKKATWTFTLEKPAMGYFSGWALVSDKAEENNSEWLISVQNLSSRQFLFGYFGITQSGFVFVQPRFNGLRVTANPDNFLSGHRQTRNGQFPVIEIDVNSAFMDAMRVGDDVDVEITISFTTQFNERVTRKYRATVIK